MKKTISSQFLNIESFQCYNRNFAIHFPETSLFRYRTYTLKVKNQETGWTHNPLCQNYKIDGRISRFFRIHSVFRREIIIIPQLQSRTFSYLNISNTQYKNMQEPNKKGRFNMSTKGINIMGNFNRLFFSSNNPNKEEIELSRTAKQLTDSKHLTDREKIDSFMDKLGSVFLESNQVEISNKLFSQDQLEKAYILVETVYIPSLNEILERSFEYDEWRLVCIKRTNIEVFNSIIKDVLKIEVDTSSIDDVIKDKAKTEGGVVSQSTDNVPKSHWWWYAE